MKLKEFDEKYGRHVLIGGVLLIWAVILWSIWANGYLETWHFWRFPAKLPPFIDFRLIPGSAETFRSGIDPAISNPGDPKARIFNYPKIWYLFFYMGISQEDTIWICVTLLVLFFLIVFAFPDKIRVRDSLILLGFIFSSSCALLYERGNVDLVIFILCGLTILLLDKFPGWATGIFSFAAMLKFFPLFGITVFLQENKRWFYKFFAASVLVFLIYIGISFDSLKASWELTQRGTFLSYGVYVIFDMLAAYIRYYLLKIMPESQIQSVVENAPHLIALAVLAVVFFLAMRKNASLESNSERNLAAFRMGTSIYVGTFFLGNNWDYRMAFLIFTVPQIAYWLFAPSTKNRIVLLVTVISLFFASWFPVVLSAGAVIYNGEFMLQLNVFDEILDWMLFSGQAYLLIASAPKWFRSYSWNPFSGAQPI